MRWGMLIYADFHNQLFCVLLTVNQQPRRERRGIKASARIKPQKPLFHEAILLFWGSLLSFL